MPPQKYWSPGLRYLLVIFLVAVRAVAAPYGPAGMEIEWSQPDGAKLKLRVFGDEFYARTETLDGYTVVYDPATRSYHYADVARDGSAFVPMVEKAHLKAPHGLNRHRSLPESTVSKISHANRTKFDGERAERWQRRVQAVRKKRAIQAGVIPAPDLGDAQASGEALQTEISAAPVSGGKVGLTILLQFPDDTNTPAVDPVIFPTDRAKIDRYCNNIGYTEDGNTGSIRDYFADQSLNALVYTQAVTQIVTLPNARNYYNYSDYPTNTTLREIGATGRMVIQHAITALKAEGFDFSSLSIDSNNKVIATNVLFAGSNSGVWSQGLWPHSWSMPWPYENVGTPGNPKYIYSYQITNIANSSPVIGTFVHENGHLLLGYPDLYDYGGDSEGVGAHCLMGSGNHNNGGKTPASLNAYLKDQVGWANITDYTPTQSAVVSIPTAGNIACRIRKPGLASEYFIVENHGLGDKWANSLPDKGIAIWHIDENKSGNNEQQMTASQHYEVSLEQADGLFDLEKKADRGDSADLFDSGDGDFTNTTKPDADWWDGANSGIKIKVTSAAGSDMDVEFGDPLPPNTLAVTSPNGGQVWYFGDTRLITWNSNVVGDVEIALLKGGVLQSVLSPAETNDGSFSWTVSAGLPAGSNYKVRIRSVSNPAFSDTSDAFFEIKAYPTLADALDTTEWSWTTGGNSNWSHQATTTHDGVDAARSGTIADDESSYLQSTFTGPGTLTFWWKVSSEAYYDYLRFYLDGAEQTGSLSKISGEVDWVQKTATVPAGVHTVKWEYRKDSSVSSGSDAAWVDQVVFTPTPKPEIAVEQPAGTDLADGTAELAFGSVNLGNTPAELSVTVKNPGTAELSGLAVIVDGPDSGDFSVSGPLATSLAPGESTTFTVSFAPGAAGTRSASLHLASNDADENPFDLALTGVGVAVPEIAVEQPAGTDLADGTAELAFGSVNLGDTPAELSVTVKNPGTAELSGLAVIVDGPDSGDFSVSGPLATSLAAGESTTFTVSFAPGAVGTRNAALHLASNDADENPFDLALTGVGVAVPEIAVEQPAGTDLADGTAELAFGSVNLGDTPAELSVTVKNPGTAELSGLAVIVDGPDSGDFSVSGPLATSLAAGESTTFTVSFAPGAVGTRNAALHLASNDADENPFDLALTGSGVAVPEIAIEQPAGTDLADGTAELAFGSVDLGGTAAELSVTVKNPGTAELSGLAVIVDGPDSGDFSVSGPLATSLAPNESTTFTVSFAPGAAGTRNAALHLASNDADENPFDLALTGSGVAVPEIAVEQPAGTDLADGTAELAFGSVNLGDTPAELSVTVKNPGTAELSGLAITVDGPDSGDFSVIGPLAMSLAPGESTAFTVSFAPGAAGTRSASLHLASNDADENPFDLALTGSGVAVPEIAIEQPAGTDLADGTAELAFGSVDLGGTAAELSVTVKNPGTAELSGLAVIVDGPDSGDFSVSGPLATSLAPNESTTFTVSFAPGAVGTRNAALHLASNDADENPFDLALTGSGVAVPEIAIEQPAGTDLVDGTAELAFGSVDLGGTAAELSVTVKNPGTAELSGLAVIVDGPDSGDFSVSGPLATSLAPGESTTFTVSFAPGAAGTRNASLHLASNDADENPFDLALTGDGVAVPEIAVEQPAGTDLADGTAELAFGSVDLGGTAAELSVTVKNPGTAELSGLAVIVDGPDSGDFSVSGPLATSLAPGESTTFTVSFAPGAAGTRNAALHLASNDADENPFDLALTGDGVAVPEIAVEQPAGTDLADGTAELAFGSVDLGGTAAELSVTVKNPGTAELSGLAVIVDGPDSGDFSVSGPLATSLAPNESTTFTVSFAPGAAGTRNASLHLASNDADENPFDLALTGVGVAVPEIAIEQPAGTDLADGTAELAFGSVDLGGTAAELSVTVKNPGTAELSGLAVIVDGPDSGDFSVSGPLATSLAPGESTTFTVSFAPGAAGTRNAALHLASNDADENPFDLALTGDGVAVPEIAVEQPAGTDLADGTAELAFGSVDLGGTAAELSVTVKNPGTAELSGLAVIVDGPDSGDFSVSGPLATSLAPNESTTFTVSFAPGAVGTRNAALHLASNDADENPFDLALTGSGVAVPEIAIEQPAGTDLVDGTAELAFGSVDLGGTAAELSVTVKNPGTAELSGLAVIVDGPDSGDFSVSGPLATSLAPGESTTFTVSFAPGAAGTRNAALHLASNDADENPFDLALTGDGVAVPEIAVEQPAGTDLADGTAELAFGSVDLGGTAAELSVTVKNPGTAELSGLAVIVDGPDSGDFSVSGPLATSLAPGESTTFTVSFAPGAAGTRNAALHLASNDADENPFDLALTGDGVAVPEIAVEQPAGTDLADGTAELDFGSVDLGGTAAELSVTVKNPGTAELSGLAVIVDGPDSGDFSVSGPLATSLAPGESTTFTVSFAPGAAGTRNAALHLASNDADENPFDLALTGDGVAVPEIAVEQPAGTDLADGTAELAFGSVDLGGTAAELSVTVKNPGTAELSGLAVIVDGPDSGDFSVSGPLATSLAPGESTTFTVSFAPGAAGTRNAALHLASNDADENPFDLALTGDGVAVPEIAVEQPAGTDLADGTAELDFGSVDLGGTPAELSVTVKNPGTAELSGLAVIVDGPDSGDFSVSGPLATSLAPNESTTFTVSFAPGAAGTRNAALHLASNDADENPFDLALTGDARTPVETWRFTEFGLVEDFGDAANDADPDGDGLSNLMEYGFQTDPSVAEKSPVNCLKSGDSFSITYPRNMAATDLTFIIEESADLGISDPWTTSSAQEEILGTDAGVQQIEAKLSLLPEDFQIFLRVKISLAP